MTTITIIINAIIIVNNLTVLSIRDKLFVLCKCIYVKKQNHILNFIII